MDIVKNAFNKFYIMEKNLNIKNIDFKLVENLKKEWDNIDINTNYDNIFDLYDNYMSLNWRLKINYNIEYKNYYLLFVEYRIELLLSKRYI
ncbi:hypothetical protein CHREV_101 [Choristoneura rosaceana entomopoxvirus 'L']|uniref:Tryptophan repeat gene family n=1 Tax=Choristoneura rosaceana entomopoxvirus 'L' TaxID=1293539 RepID=A0ABM9QKE6_9POXV|nr:hypothetical protein CHREV_101 [Choristoneura rosaceana entomopoxvirus 'L']CCU56003.1 hypothetical protein CHREV_101 [Choristoneura rosaceana entomopoxvirus 'L']